MAEKKKVEFVKKLEKTGKRKKESSLQSWKELKRKLWRNIREKDREYETEEEAEVDMIEEADIVLEILEELEADANRERIEAERVILGEENQSKNLSIVQIPDGTNETNDTPVFVEVEVKSEESVLDRENQAKNPEVGEKKEVVEIPNGSLSIISSLSSPNINISQQEDLTTCPDIYKKGVCPPP